MPYDPDRHRRRSIRLKGHDYGQEGVYFFTAILEHRLCLCGEVRGGIVGLSAAGSMFWEAWGELPERFPFLVLNEFIVMPNHVHGIVVFVGAGLVPAQNSGSASGTRPTGELGEQPRAIASAEPVSHEKKLGEVIGAFKSITTHRYTKGVKTLGWPPFDQRLWQRNYHERIVRDEAELEGRRRYIAHNPLEWPLDEDNPYNKTK